MNATVILCDTLRRDHCGPYHHGRAVSECGSGAPPELLNRFGLDGP